MTFLSTVVIDVDIGLIIGVLFNISVSVFQSLSLHLYVLLPSEQSENVWIYKKRFPTIPTSDICIVQIVGSLNVLSMMLLNLRIKIKIWPIRPKLILIDLTRLTYSDSSSLKMLESLCLEFQKTNGIEVAVFLKDSHMMGSLKKYSIKLNHIKHIKEYINKENKV